MCLTTHSIQTKESLKHYNPAKQHAFLINISDMILVPSENKNPNPCSQIYILLPLIYYSTIKQCHYKFGHYTSR